MATNIEQAIWGVDDVTCVMRSCCQGAELQLRRDSTADEVIVLRELHPTHADLYDRARALEAELRAGADPARRVDGGAPDSQSR